MPVMELKSNIKPTTFAYPPPLEIAKKEEKERVTTAVLSVTAKAKRREAEKTKGDKAEPMEVDEEKEVKPIKEEESVPVIAEAKKEEPNFEILKNPARVMKQQVIDNSLKI
jgi:26S proteasome regulatory subunit N2